MLMPRGEDVLIQAQKRLQRSGQYADLKIIVGNTSFAAHKAIVCPRVEYFEKACNWGKNGDSKDVVDLGPDEDPLIVSLMLNHLYQLDYCDLDMSKAMLGSTSSPNQPSDWGSVEWLLHKTEGLGMVDRISQLPISRRLAHDLTKAGQKFKDSTQQHVGKCESRVTQRINEGVKDEMRKTSLTSSGLGDDNDMTNRLVVNAKVYVIAEKYHIPGLKEQARWKFEYATKQSWKSHAFVRAAEIAFNDTIPHEFERGLQDIIVEVFGKHRQLLDYPEVEDLMESGCGFATAILRLFRGTR